jgi:hypothetical protein
MKKTPVLFLLFLLLVTLDQAAGAGRLLLHARGAD